MAKKIQIYVVFFLEELDFAEKRSHHTLKAYASDLLQSLSFYLKGELKGPKIDGSHKYEYIPHLHETDNVWDENIFQQNISKYLHSISHLEAATRARKIATLRKFFTFLKQQKLLDKIPSYLVTPKQSVKIPHFISVDEILSVVNGLTKAPPSIKNHQREILFFLLYGAGLRVSEACELQWPNIDIEKRQLRILGKGEKTRLISFPKCLQEKLRTLFKQKKSASIWGETALLRRTAYNLIRECGVMGQLSKPLNPHALRHSFATHLLNDGADLRIIQELLGHSSLAATEKYTHISLDQLTQTMESFHPLAKKA